MRWGVGAAFLASAVTSLGVDPATLSISTSVAESQLRFTLVGTLTASVSTNAPVASAGAGDVANAVAAAVMALAPSIAAQSAALASSAAALGNTAKLAAQAPAYASSLISAAAKALSTSDPDAASALVTAAAGASIGAVSSSTSPVSAGAPIVSAPAAPVYPNAPASSGMLLSTTVIVVIAASAAVCLALVAGGACLWRRRSKRAAARAPIMGSKGAAPSPAERAMSLSTTNPMRREEGTTTLSPGKRPSARALHVLGGIMEGSNAAPQSCGDAVRVSRQSSVFELFSGTAQEGIRGRTYVVSNAALVSQRVSP